MPNPMLSDPKNVNPQLVTGQLVVAGNTGAGQDFPVLRLQPGAATNVSNLLQSEPTGGGTPIAGINASGILFGGQLSPPVIKGAATAVAIVLTAAQSGTTVVSLTTSGAQLITLPTVALGAVSGMWFRCLSGVGSTVQMQLKTVDAAVIRAKVSNAAAAAAITSTATTGDVHNTTGTMIVGDNLTVVFDGTDWDAVSQSGTWAAT